MSSSQQHQDLDFYSVVQERELMRSSVVSALHFLVISADMDNWRV